MSSCLHPISRTIYCPVDGSSHTIDIPCGKCINCLHRFQDSWQIRLYETCKFYGSFIYDTLTFRDESLPLCDVSDVVLNSCFVADDVLRLIDIYSGDSSSFLVPYVDRSIIRDWIRRARELFVYNNAYRPKWKYFVVMEYGPKTSRPHFHLLFFGCSLGDYKRYLGDVWKARYGFTKCKYVIGDTRKDASCISRYVSKYVSKGVFESPLVRDGFCPKPFRCISHGIGEEYLERSIFDYFRSSSAKFLKSISYDLDFEPTTSARVAPVRNFVRSGALKGFRVSKSVLKSLVVYYDDAGFAHSCPSYYKSKLLSLFKPNVFSYAIQTHLYSYFDLYRRTCLARFANILGKETCDLQSPTLGLSKESYLVLCRRFVVAEKNEAKSLASRRYITLSNFYKRPISGAYCCYT